MALLNMEPPAMIIYVEPQVSYPALFHNLKKTTAYTVCRYQSVMDERHWRVSKHGYFVPERSPLGYVWLNG